MKPQFESLARQHATVRFGMWVFLGSESLLFAGLLALFAAYRAQFPAEFAAAAGHADVALGTANTYVLLTSSLTVALALHEAQRGRRRALLFLAATIVLGLVFLVLKGIEYGHHLAVGIAPGHTYAFAELPARGHALYFTLYYLLTGLHALHVTGGILALAWLGVRLQRARPSLVGLECGALYWHLVDLVWLFLWPLLYLIR